MPSELGRHIELESQLADVGDAMRAHMRHRDGTLRDTHVFSILRHEWPALADALRRKLGNPPNV